MGICKIQKPTSFREAHGEIFVKIICNEIENEPVKYEGDKGDLYINLICEEDEDSGLFCLCKDNEQEIINELKNKIEIMQQQINELQEKINNGLN